MNIKLLLNCISILIYLLTCISVFLIFNEYIIGFFYTDFRLLNRRKKKSHLYKYLERLFISIFNYKNDRDLEKKVYVFLIFTFIIFIFVFMIVLKYNLCTSDMFRALISATITAVLISLVPFMILIARLYKTQKNSSREALILSTEIMNQYKLHNNNIIEAIDASIKNLDNKIICRKYLIRLSIRLKSYKTEAELKDSIDEFVFSVNTNWIKLLSDSIIFSITNNIDISASLEGLIEQIGSIEYNKSVSGRLNNEGFAMAKYMAPLLYVVLVIIASKMMGFRVNDFFMYQFTGQGLKYFISIILLYIICMLIEYMFKSRKFDF